MAGEKGNGSGKVKDYIGLVLGGIAIIATIWGYAINYAKIGFNQQTFTEQIKELKQENKELKKKIEDSDVKTIDLNFKNLEKNVNEKLNQYGEKVTKVYEWHLVYKDKNEEVYNWYIRHR